MPAIRVLDLGVAALDAVKRRPMALVPKVIRLLPISMP
jgi:hypothetical protein